MFSHRLRGSAAVFSGLFTLIGLWLLLGLTGGTHPASAAPGTLYVAPTGTDNGLCSASQPCHTLQHAVDLSASGDTIKVAAGQYTGVTSRFNPYEGQTVTQVVYISKTVIIRGGYTTAFTEPPNPAVNTTSFNAQQQGRVFHLFGNSAPTLEGLRITGGQALDGTYYGGGVYVRLAQAQINNCQIDNNVASFGGGGVWLDESPSTISNSTIHSNSADDGGGIYLNNSANARLTGSAIFTNTAEHYGGGVYVSGGSGIRMDNNHLHSNAAVESGGGLYVANSAAQIDSNRITLNYAGYSSGGLQLSQSTTQLNGNQIVTNTAAYDGGGVYLDSSQGDVLYGNTIAHNTASREGGGVFISGGRATLNENLIQANYADYGGGLKLSNSATAFNGNRVVANTAGWDGGALWVTGGNVVTMTNTLIADNQIVNGQGSGLYIAGSSATLLHTTLARNTGSSGRGVYLTDWGLPSVYSSVTLTNSIIANQTVGVYADSGSTARLESTLWTNNGTDAAGAGMITEAHHYTGGANFAPDGYHILAGSAAIDKGVDAAVKLDIDSEPRPYLAPDLGADEYWAPGALHKVYLPVTMKTP
jgi:hypothetical protein